MLRFPENRKQSTEIYRIILEKEITSDTLKSELEKLDFQRSETYKKYDAKYPIGEMTLYDNMLDAAVMVGFTKILIG